MAKLERRPVAEFREKFGWPPGTWLMTAAWVRPRQVIEWAEVGGKLMVYLRNRRRYTSASTYTHCQTLPVDTYETLVERGSR